MEGPLAGTSLMQNISLYQIRKVPYVNGNWLGDALQAIKTFISELEVKNDNELKELADELQEQIKALKENCADLTNQVSALNEQIDDLERNGDSSGEADELKKEVEEFRTYYKEEKKRLEKVVAMETGLKKEQRSRARFSRRMLTDEMEGLKEQLEAQTAPTTNKRRLQRTKSIDLNSLSNRINVSCQRDRERMRSVHFLE
jgi:chromosome segregation ATPase